MAHNKKKKRKEEYILHYLLPRKKKKKNDAVMHGVRGITFLLRSGCIDVCTDILSLIPHSVSLGEIQCYIT